MGKFRCSSAYIPRVDSSFDPRNYGFAKFGKLIRSLDYVEVQQKNIDSGSNTYIDLKILMVKTVKLAIKTLNII